MKKGFFLSIIIGCFVGNISSAQQIINGDFESWTDQYHAQTWIMNSFAITGCSPSPYHNVSQSSDRNSGSWAVKLKSDSCINDFGMSVVFIGFMYYGDKLNPNFLQGMPYNERPGEFNFYYKFSSIGNDTGFAKIALRLLNGPNGTAGDTIGEGKISIVNNTSTYTLMTVPINYSMPDTPQLIEITFTTSKTLMDSRFPQISATPGMGANAGTTLWIDDVSVSGGTLGIGNVETKKGIKIYPNPLTASSTLQLNTQLKNAEVVIYDMLGKEMLRKKMDGDRMEIEKGSLESGVYFVRVSTEERQYVQKIIVE